MAAKKVLFIVPLLSVVLLGMRPVVFLRPEEIAGHEQVEFARREF